MVLGGRRPAGGVGRHGDEGAPWPGPRPHQLPEAAPPPGAAGISVGTSGACGGLARTLTPPHPGRSQVVDGVKGSGLGRGSRDVQPSVQRALGGGVERGVLGQGQHHCVRLVGERARPRGPAVSGVRPADPGRLRPCPFPAAHLLRPASDPEVRSGRGAGPARSAGRCGRACAEGTGAVDGGGPCPGPSLSLLQARPPHPPQWPLHLLVTSRKSQASQRLGGTRRQEPWVTRLRPCLVGAPVWMTVVTAQSCSGDAMCSVSEPRASRPCRQGMRGRDPGRSELVGDGEAPMVTVWTGLVKRRRQTRRRLLLRLRWAAQS